MPHVPSIIVRAASIVLVIASVAWQGAPAHAQPEGGPMGWMRAAMPAAVSSRGFERAMSRLNLTEEQKAAAEALFSAYQVEARAARDRMNDAVNEARQTARETGDWTVFRDLGTAGRELREARAALDRQLMDDVKSLLNPDQVEAWPGVERSIRREQSMPRGTISGERADVAAIIERLEIDEATKAALDPVLAAYEEELDRELIKRNEAYDDAAARFLEVRESGDQQAMTDLVTRGREASARVRDVNRKFARQVVDVLPEEKRETFNDNFQRDSFPDVYRATMAARQLEAVGGFEDLDEAQKEAVALLRAGYEKRVAELNKALAAAIEEQEANFDPAQMFGRRGGRGENPTMEVRRERRQLDQKTAEDLRALLRPEQVERLPRPGRDGRRGMEGEEI